MNYNEFTKLSPKELIGTWKIFIDKESTSWASKIPFIVIVEEFMLWGGFTAINKSFIDFYGIVSNDENKNIGRTTFWLSDCFDYIKLK